MATFKWFSVITVGLMARSNLLGTTSVIRTLALNPGCYEAMNLFFRASSYSTTASLYTVDGLRHLPLYYYLLTKQRIAGMQQFLAGQTEQIEEYDENLVRRMEEKITVYEDKLAVEFKSGTSVDVGR